MALSIKIPFFFFILLSLYDNIPAHNLSTKTLLYTKESLIVIIVTTLKNLVKIGFSFCN